MIYIGSDHRGYDLKQLIENEFEKSNINFGDCGDGEFNPEDDYPDYAFFVGEKVRESSSDFGVLICGSGEGMTIAANKVKGIRAALCFDENSVKLSRQHNNANILVLDSKLTLEKSIELINIFLDTSFSNEERHIRRLNKISDYENLHIKD